MKETSKSVKCKAIKIEEIELNKAYTISINPKIQPDDMSKKKVYVWYRKFYEFVNKYKDGVYLSLYIESSPTGRLHFHGILKVLEIIKYIDLLQALSASCSYEIDTIENLENTEWFDYMRKQREIWEEYFRKNIIGYPMQIDKDINIFPENEDNM